MKASDPRDLLMDRLEEGQYIIASPELLADLGRLSGSSKLQGMWADLDVIVANTRELAAGTDPSGIDADRLEVIIEADAQVQLLVEYFSYFAHSLPFELRRALFLLAVTLQDAGALVLAADDVAGFFSPSFLSLLLPLPKAFRTASICIAAEELGQRAFDEAQRRAQSHIGRHAAELVAFRATKPERFADRIQAAIENATAIARSTLKKRGEMAAALAIAGADSIRLDDDLLPAETFEAIAELAKGRDLIDLIVRPQVLNVFPARVASRIVDASRKAMATKRTADVVDVDDLKDVLPAPEATAEDHLYLARLVRETSDRDHKIFQLLLQRRTDKEIADALGMRPTAASKAISRLRQRLTG
jgi:DNA-binding NarL/FixJ family response regulator